MSWLSKDITEQPFTKESLTPMAPETQTMAGPQQEALAIHIAGLVQGVGFRPSVWTLATRYRLRGRVLNTGEGLQIVVAGRNQDIHRFITELTASPPPMAAITGVSLKPLPLHEVTESRFIIAESAPTGDKTGILPDVATCQDCLEDIFDPAGRRFKYPFTTCTRCGPRLTIQQRIPYDRANTTMHHFAMCSVCLSEYQDPADRRFHAQPIACHACGPNVRLEHVDGQPVPLHVQASSDALEPAGSLLLQGHILAIKGLGGFQLACDATREETVRRLRERKGREGKPFALMAKNLEQIRQYCQVNDLESSLLRSPAAPLLILQRNQSRRLAPTVSPGLNTYAFMLPNSPVHHLLLNHLPHPIVLTSGNRAGEPQWIKNAEAKDRLKGLADGFLLHDREIVRRLDDSVVRVIAEQPRMVRRGRGYAPAPLSLPSGFTQASPLLAMGGELKNTFCFVQHGQALVSHHIGDLEDAHTYEDYCRALQQYRTLFSQTPMRIAIDLHPDYLSSQLGRGLAVSEKLQAMEVQHHHAHFASCLADNEVPRQSQPILGIILDGLGYGHDQTLWGGEFLLGHYESVRRLATFTPVPMLGGVQAIKEPWRNTYAHLDNAMGWATFSQVYHQLPLFKYLEAKPRKVLDQAWAGRLNCPLTSSCGRLFDAVAAAMGICPDEATYEGQAAIELESLVDETVLLQNKPFSAYPFGRVLLPDSGLPAINPVPMWKALLDDLQQRTPVPLMAARFHKGLTLALTHMVEYLNGSPLLATPVSTVALSGGVFQNRILLELLHSRLQHAGFTVLSQSRVPMNDGGLSFGQAMVAAAQTIPSCPEGSR